MVAFKATVDPRVDPLGFAREVRAAGATSFELPGGLPSTELCVRAALYEVDGMDKAAAWTQAIDDRPALLTEMQIQTAAEFASRPALEVQADLKAIATVKALREGKPVPGSPATITDTVFTTDANGRIVGKRTIEVK